MKDNNKSKATFSTLKGIHKAIPIILGGLALFIGLCLIIPGMGALGDGIRNLLLGLFSAGAYLIPIVLAVHAFCFPSDLDENKIKHRAIFSSVATILVSCIDYAIFYWSSEPVFAPADGFVNMNGGGFIGGIFGFLLSALFGQLGVIIVCAIALAIYAVFYYAEKAGSLGQAALQVVAMTKNLVGIIKDKHNDVKEKKRLIKEEADQHQRELSSQELIDDEFFKAKGAGAEIKIRQLGIEESESSHGLSALVDPVKRVVEEEPELIVDEEPERRRRRSDKPVDLNYGIEQTEPRVEPAEEETAEDKPKFNNAFFGLDDSADAVFTKDFDPFDFATSEKAAAKYASKVSAKAGVTEELDEMTIAEMKANHEPDERERRMMELERKKQEWMRTHGNKRPAPASVRPVQPVAPAAETPVFSAPTPVATPAPVVASATVAAPTPIPTPAHTATPVIHEEPKVSTYSSYSNTKTTYNQPIKTVEFTITKEPKAQPVAPIESKPVSYSFDKVDHREEAPEDVAILISQRIAQNNPTYARSANDLKTYTKIVSSEDDELYRQLQGISIPTTESSPVPEYTAPVENENVDADDDLILADEQENTAATDVAEAEVIAESALPESVEFSIGAEKDVVAAPSAQSIYQRAAGFASAMVNETVTEFKPYIAPSAPIQTTAEAIAVKEETLAVERNMLSPTPVVSTVNPVVAEAAQPTLNPEVSVVTPAPAVPSEPAVVAESLFTVVGEDSLAEAKEEIREESFEVSFTESAEDKSTDGFDEEEEEIDSEPEEDADVVEIPPEEQNPDVIKMREMFPFLEPLNQQKPASQPTREVRDEISVEAEIEDVPFDEPVQVKIPSTSLVPAKEKKKAEKKKPDYSDFKFPSLDFLAKEESLHDENIQAEIQENADKLIETLASFGVTASIKGVDRGPRITRYEVVPAKGVKVSQIMNLQDDIALNLAAGSIRMEAPIPGKSAVGIEIPNKKSSIVRLRDLLETADFESAKSKTFVCIGRDVAGQPVFGDLAKMPHLLIAGATGMGKSVCINSLLISVLYKARPDEVKLIMIDPKQVEFTMYNGIPHLLVPVVSDPKQAAGALMWAVEEMERRYNLLNPLCVRNVEAYNEKVTADPSLGEPMPKIIIVIDEFADLMLQVKDPVESLVTRIAQKARAAGIHLVIGTQRPSVNVITGVIKANVPSRISCKVMSNVDSKTVLDSAGAEKLLDRGDALYAPAGSPKPHRLQCAFVADGEVEAIMNYLKQYSDGDSYDSTVMEDIKRAADKCNKKGGSADRDDYDEAGGSGEGYLNDRQFLDAVEVAVNTRKISTSLIQRKLSIGYGKAAKFIDIMEDMGIVGEANGQRPREVLLSPDEWREKLARATLD